ncbi:restriction endonuclease [Escherichia coli]|nr:restriction endonuclease [Escherichia coli]
MLPSETMIWQPEFTDKTLSRKPGAVHFSLSCARCLLHGLVRYLMSLPSHLTISALRLGECAQ